MAEVKRIPSLVVEFDDGSRASVTGVEDVQEIEEILGRSLPSDPEFDVQQESDNQAASIPGWASWTEQQTLDWIDANVDDLVSAKTAIKAMTRMLIALRNKTWPNLQE